MEYREAVIGDVAAMAAIRSGESETPAYWQPRIEGYMNAEMHPQEALPARVIYLATENGEVAGFIAGHLTRRFKCDGELQWINIIPAYRRTAMADELLRILAKWFVQQHALNVCVNTTQENTTARRFYERNGATDLSNHWLAWTDIGMVLHK